MSRLKKHRSLLIVVALIITFLCLVLAQFYPKSPRAEKRMKVSMIVYGDDSERWENMRQGAALVCKEKNADLTMMTTLSEKDAEEQIEITKREIEDGADAIIIAACNSSRLKEYFDENHIGIPVVFIESLNSSDNDRLFIAPDDREMGKKLGEEIVNNESDIVTVSIISENTEKDSVSLREEGFREAVEGKVGKIIDWKRNEQEANTETRMFIQKAIVSEATDVIVTFDNSSTDALLDALSNLNKKSKIYSISTSNMAVYNLNKGDIKALGCPNEFSMGYLAAAYAIDGSHAKKTYPDKRIEYKIIRKETMYDKDNQALLFPFVN